MVRVLVSKGLVHSGLLIMMAVVYEPPSGDRWAAYSHILNHTLILALGLSSSNPNPNPTPNPILLENS